MSCVCPVSLLSFFVEAKSHQDRGLIEAQCRRPERRPTQSPRAPCGLWGAGVVGLAWVIRCGPWRTAGWQASAVWGLYTLPNQTCWGPRATLTHCPGPGMNCTLLTPALGPIGNMPLGPGGQWAAPARPKPCERQRALGGFFLLGVREEELATFSSGGCIR